MIFLRVPKDRFCDSATTNLQVCMYLSNKSSCSYPSGLKAYLFDLWWIKKAARKWHLSVLWIRRVYITLNVSGQRYHGGFNQPPESSSPILIPNILPSERWSTTSITINTYTHATHIYQFFFVQTSCNDWISRHWQSEHGVSKLPQKYNSYLHFFYYRKRTSIEWVCKTLNARVECVFMKV